MQANNQPIERPDHRTSGVLEVNSTFHTIQGEGPYAGRAAFFIRLAGCNLQCPGCDTDYTSERMNMTVEDVVNHVSAQRDSGDLVVITGGEPFRQNIVPAVRQLLRAGFKVQVETNGTLYLPEFPYLTAAVVVSPKTPRINPLVAAQATAYKYVLSHDSVDPEDGLPVFALYRGMDMTHASRVERPPAQWLALSHPIYLQPMDAQDPKINARNVAACVESVMRHKRYTLGVQMHKITGLP